MCPINNIYTHILKIDVSNVWFNNLEQIELQFYFLKIPMELHIFILDLFLFTGTLSSIHLLKIQFI